MTVVSVVSVVSVCSFASARAGSGAAAGVLLNGMMKDWFSSLNRIPNGSLFPKSTVSLYSFLSL